MLPNPITIGLHKWSSLNPFLLVIVMGEMTIHIQTKVPCCLLFTNDIILVDQTTTTDINEKLEFQAK